MLPRIEDKWQLSVNNFWSCILGNYGDAWIYEFVTELLNTFIGRNMKYYRKSLHSKIIDIANCTTFKLGLLAVEYTILIRYYYQTAKARSLYVSTAGSAGWHAYNLPNWDELRDVCLAIPELKIWVNWQFRLRMWQWFGSNPDPHPKWWSGAVANITFGSWSLGVMRC